MDRERKAEIAIRSVGRPRLRWEDDVRADLGKIKIENWSKMITMKTVWTRTVEKAKSHKELSLEEEEEEEGEKEKEGKKKKTKSLLRQHTFRK